MSIKNVLSTRMWVVIGVTALIIALPVVDLMQQSAVAAPPPPLRGPFKFIEVPTDNKTGGLSTLTQLTPTVIYSDTFTSFVPIINPSVTEPGWQLYVNGDAADQKWGRVLFSDSGFTNTLWSTGYYSPVQSASSTYVPNMDAWVVYGPLNPMQFRQIQVQFDVYLKAGSGARIGWAGSADGQNWCGTTKLSSTGQWIRNITYDLPACSGQTPVYVALFFQSDASAPAGLGAFIDNVVISGQYLLNTYLPYARLDPTVTPTPTPIASATPPYALAKSWTFEADSNYSTWCLTSNDDWSANVRYRSSDAGYYYFLRAKQSEYLAMLSPRFTTPSNYRIAAKFSFLRFNENGRDLANYGSAQFGLIFGVDGLGFPAGDGQECSWGDNSTGSWYKFMLKIKDGGGGYVTRLERFDQNNGWALLAQSDLPSGLTISRTDWNTMILDRNGSGIVAYINGIQVLNRSDGTYKGGRWFGIFTETQGNNGSSDFESDWDNIQVYNLTP